MKCPLCGSATSVAFETQGIDILDCLDCGHRFAHVEGGELHVNANYDDSYFYGGGAGYSDYSAEADLLQKRGRMYANKVARFTEPGRMLDVGAAAGFILKGFEDCGWNGMGLEPNHTMVEFGRSHLSLEISQGSLESFETDRRFDMISMIQVAAHFYDPKRAFEKAYKLLNRHGLLLVETWDRGSLSARLFGKNWHEYSPPSVLHWYTKPGLTAFLEGLGFERVAGGRPPKKISGGHIRSLLKYRLGDNSFLSLIPESVNFPYPSEDLFWALYKKC